MSSNWLRGSDSSGAGAGAGAGLGAGAGAGLEVCPLPWLSSSTGFTSAWTGPVSSPVLVSSAETLALTLAAGSGPKNTGRIQSER